MNGAGELSLMKQTGHRPLATVRCQVRDVMDLGALFHDSAASKLRLKILLAVE